MIADMSDILLTEEFCESYVTDSVLVSQGYCNKVHKVGGLNNRISLSHFTEV